MTPEEYCYQKSVPLGSPLYFTLRKLTRRQSAAIAAIYAFYQEIEDVILNFEDLSVAQAKLNWWRDEVVKIQDGLPEHPVSLALQKTKGFFSLDIFSLIKMIDGFEHILVYPIFATFEDVVIFLMRTAGVRELLIANVQMQNDTIMEDRIHQMTLGYELVHWIQHLHRYVKKGFVFFGQDELQQFQVSESELQALKTTENIRELLKFQAEKVRRSYQLVKNQKITPELNNLRMRFEIAYQILLEIEKSHFTVLENYITITPLRSWWIAL